jgi:hypothetical protein
MNVIATAKIIAVSTRLFDWPRPLGATVITIPRNRDGTRRSQASSLARTRPERETAGPDDQAAACCLNPPGQVNAQAAGDPATPLARTPRADVGLVEGP